MKRKIIFIIISVILIACGYIIYVNKHRDYRLMRYGDAIVIKVDKYKYINGRLPNSLREIGVIEKDGADAIYYLKQDSVNYMLWYGVSLGESMTYYSDSKKWENSYRKMKNAPARNK